MMSSSTVLSRLSQALWSRPMRVSAVVATLLGLSLALAPASSAITVGSHPAAVRSAESGLPTSYSGRSVSGLRRFSVSPGLTRRFTEAHDARLSGWGDSNTRFSAAGPQSPSGQQPDPVATTDNTTHHFDSGIQLTAATTGMAAMQSITPTGSELSASDQDSVLSPTLYPAANSCIEVTTVANSDGYSVSPFDWCGYPSGARGWQPGRKIDASFLSTYMTSSYGLPSYWVQIRQTNPATNTWTAYLYNFQTKAWDSLYSSSGATGKPGIQGWDIAEFYSTSNPATSTGYFCTETRGMAWESNDIMLLVNGKFTWASASNSRQVPGGGANCPLSYKVIATNSHWRVQNVS